MQGEPLTVLWRPNLEDAHYAVRMGWWGDRQRRIRTFILVFVLPIALFSYIVSEIAHVDASTALALGVVAGAASGAICLWAFGAWLARQIVSKQRRTGDLHRILVTDEGVERILAARSMRYPWDSVARIEETPRMFILNGRTGPLTCIEKSGIDSDADLRRLRDFLRARKPGRYYAR